MRFSSLAQRSSLSLVSLGVALVPGVAAQVHGSVRVQRTLEP